MKHFVFIDQSEGKIKKASLEAASYAVAAAGDEPVCAVVLGAIHSDELNTLGQYGIQKVLHDNADLFNHFDTKAFATAISKLALGADTITLSFNQNGKQLAGYLAASMKAGLVSGVNALPANNVYRKNVFSGKAIALVKVKSDTKIIAITPNSYPITRKPATLTVETVAVQLAANEKTIKVIETRKASGGIPLSEAELVVSGGRGMKGPENWGMIEELAKEMGAATACSRPVGDMHWRPHHEHVGQTGGTIRPNLYIAIGISGAIQHLAGVNSSKTIVVINTDKEAPFFKAADYGIIGDAFTVVPNLIKAYKEYKNSAH